MQYLYRVADDQPFAYARGRRDFFLVSDDTLWAHESHSRLLSAASSATLARRISDTYYDSETGTPLYYEVAELETATYDAIASVTRHRKRR